MNLARSWAAVGVGAGTCLRWLLKGLQAYGNVMFGAIWVTPYYFFHPDRPDWEEQR